MWKKIKAMVGQAIEKVSRIIEFLRTVTAWQWLKVCAVVVITTAITGLLYQLSTSVAISGCTGALALIASIGKLFEFEGSGGGT